MLVAHVEDGRTYADLAREHQLSRGRVQQIVESTSRRLWMLADVPDSQQPGSITPMES
jgi:hypothetical protein